MDEFSKQGKLKPHVELFQASAFKEAFRRVAQREVTGKAVILWKQPSKL
jgi:D-arabinose 1-dehydrogenase-like Zn-dependent alcohol dehydrogenase